MAIEPRLARGLFDRERGRVDRPQDGAGAQDGPRMQVQPARVRRIVAPHADHDEHLVRGHARGAQARHEQRREREAVEWHTAVRRLVIPRPQLVERPVSRRRDVRRRDAAARRAPRRAPPSGSTAAPKKSRDQRVRGLNESHAYVAVTTALLRSVAGAAGAHRRGARGHHLVFLGHADTAGNAPASARPAQSGRGASKLRPSSTPTRDSRLYTSVRRCSRRRCR